MGSGARRADFHTRPSASGGYGTPPYVPVTANNANPREWGRSVALGATHFRKRVAPAACDRRLRKAALLAASGGYGKPPYVPVTANNANPREWGRSVALGATHFRKRVAPAACTRRLWKAALLTGGYGKPPYSLLPAPGG